MLVPHQNRKADFLTIKIMIEELNMRWAGVVKLAKEVGKLMWYKNIYKQEFLLYTKL